MTASKHMDLLDLAAAADRAARLLKVLSNRDRLLLLCQMTQGEFAVGELQEMTGVAQPTLSQQLTVLREEQLVSTRRDGKKIFYNIASREAAAVLQVLYQLYCPAE
jgi:ArsR family transcriptional regulator